MLDVIQEHLEAIYGIRCEYRARDFLIDEEAARALGGTGRAREEVLLSESPEGLELALYLEPSLLSRVSKLEPADALAADLGDFCEVAEGVSHFVYLAQTASLERRVSLLELEAQAEVDKFAVCTLLSWGASQAAELIAQLFDRVRLREGLSEAERWRYVESSRVAKAYCERLAPMVRAHRLDRLLTELRHAYRLGAEAKLQYFARVR
jgi:hypothetical protein